MGSISAPSLSRHISDEFPSLEALVAAAEAVQLLQEHPGWSVLQRLIEAEIATIDAKLDGDRVLDSKSEYAHLHGRRGGLRAAPALMTKLVDRAESRMKEQRRRHEDAGETVLERV